MSVKIIRRLKPEEEEILRKREEFGGRSRNSRRA
jgi:hypothetical protein